MTRYWHIFLQERHSSGKIDGVVLAALRQIWDNPEPCTECKKSGSTVSCELGTRTKCAPCEKARLRCTWSAIVYRETARLSLSLYGIEDDAFDRLESRWLRGAGVGTNPALLQPTNSVRRVPTITPQKRPKDTSTNKSKRRRVEPETAHIVKDAECMGVSESPDQSDESSCETDRDEFSQDQSLHTPSSTSRSKPDHGHQWTGRPWVLTPDAQALLCAPQWDEKLDSVAEAEAEKSTCAARPSHSEKGASGNDDHEGEDSSDTMTNTGLESRDLDDDDDEEEDFEIFDVEPLLASPSQSRQPSTTSSTPVPTHPTPCNSHSSSHASESQQKATDLLHEWMPNLDPLNANDSIVVSKDKLCRFIQTELDSRRINSSSAPDSSPQMMIDCTITSASIEKVIALIADARQVYADTG